MCCEAEQCTNGCRFDSRSRCMRLLGAPMLAVGFGLPKLRLSSVFTIHGTFDSVFHGISVAFTVLREVLAEKTALSYRHQSLPDESALVCGKKI